jgi:1,4-dihydroxy-2-naphthoate octaprenyltransferase
LLIGQAGGDYLYYYFTHRHTDTRDSHTKIFAGWRPFFTNILPEKNGTLIAGIACLVIDLVIGYYFFTIYGYTVLLLALAGGLVAIFFTPLMLRGLKEPVVFITFGPLSMLGMYFVMTGDMSYIPLLVSLPVASLVTIVAYLKGAKFEIKNEGDKQIVVNLNRSVIIYLSILAYLSIVGLVLLKVMPVWTLLGLLSIPVSISVLTVIRKQSSEIQDYLWAVVRSIVALLSTGILIGIGYLI